MDDIVTLHPFQQYFSYIRKWNNMIMKALHCEAISVKVISDYQYFENIQNQFILDSKKPNTASAFGDVLSKYLKSVILEVLHRS